MQKRSEQLKPSEYFAEMAKRYEKHKTDGGTVFDFEPDREQPHFIEDDEIQPLPPYVTYKIIPETAPTDSVSLPAGAPSQVKDAPQE